jgi:isoquinoline 1-oxidoreductase beta subunit
MSFELDKSSDFIPPTQTIVASIERRKLLGFAIAGPILTLGAGLATPTESQAALLQVPPDTTDFFDYGDLVYIVAAPSMPLIRLMIESDGRARLELPRLEFGQGISTACAMMIAEELDLPLNQVHVVASDARQELGFNQQTGGSTTMRLMSGILPYLAAQARARLIRAAANKWGLSHGSLSTRDGMVIGPGVPAASYGSLSAAAAQWTVPIAGVYPKSPSQYRIVGKPARRVDALDIVTGQKKFTLDQAVPDAKPTMVRRPPTIGGTFRRIENEGQVRQMPGVIGIVVIPGGGSFVPNPPGVAVMAETFGQAWDAVRALKVTWGPGSIDQESDVTIQQKLHQATVPFQIPPLLSKVVEAEFVWAAAAHAPLEVECAIADVRANSAEIWAGLQSPVVTQKAVALDLNLPISQVKVHVVPSGGAFGRRLFWDAVQQAIQVSKALGRPCKLMYHRTDDMRHTRLRPPQFHRARALILMDQVVSYAQRVALPRTDTRHGLGEMLTAGVASAPGTVQQTVGNFAFEQALFNTMVSSPYNMGLNSKILTPIAMEMNTSSFRSVHIQPTRGVEEIMVDEISRVLKKDPVNFRLETLRHARAQAVLRKVAEQGQWGKAMPAGFAQGVGVHQESRSYTACLVEIDARNPKAPQVTKAVIAIDVGRVINPLGVEAQIQGGLMESIALVLSAGLHIEKGLPLEGSYSQYHFPRMKDYPKIVQIIIMPGNGEAVGGLGEVGMSATTGAIANAYTRATGIKARKFPLNHPVDFDPIPPGDLPVPRWA